MELPRRKSIRLRGYDYRSAGVYFVTICAQDRRMLLGKVDEGNMRLNQAGKMVLQWWNEMPRKFPAAQQDALAVMPNHLHALIVISNVPGGHIGSPLPRTALPSLARVVQWWKSMATNEYFRHVKTDGWPAVRGSLWQRNYFEHIVRNVKSLDRFRNYIAENPRRWSMDRENPKASGGVQDEIDQIIAEDCALELRG